ncbi:metabotropic glutamate receptor 8-like isoform X1 [Clytia hemisphaerica]
MRLLMVLFFISNLAKIKGDKIAHKVGDLILIGLFKGNGSIPRKPECSIPRPVFGILPIITMTQTIDEINSNYLLKKNLTLGYAIFDLCRESSIQRDILAITRFDHIAGIIGPEDFQVAQLVVPIMSLYYVPMLSLNEIGLSIDRRHMFDVQHWIVPSIVDTADAVIDFVAEMDWNYVGIFYQENKYGWSAAHSIKTSAMLRGVCVHDMIRFKTGTTIETYQNFLDFVVENTPLLKVFILMLQEAELIKFLNGLKMSKHINDITFLAMSSWGTKKIVVEGNEAVSKGVITFQPYYPAELPSLSNFFHNREIFKSNLYKIYKLGYCNTDPYQWNATECQNDEIFFENKFGNITHSNAYGIANSVYAFLTVFNNLIDRGYNERHLTSYYGWYQTVIELDKLKTYTAPSLFNKQVFEFKNNRRVYSNIAIYNYQETTKGVFEYRKIGSWVKSKNLVPRPPLNLTNFPRFRTGKLTVSKEHIQWRNRHKLDSNCSPKCGINEIKAPYTKCPRECWNCQKCPAEHVAMNNTCVLCIEYERPNPLKSVCETLPLTGASIPFGLQVTVYFLSIISSLITLTFVYGFIYFKDHHIIKASSRELSILTLTGVLAWNLVPLINMTRPTKILCFLNRTVMYQGFSLVYGPLFLKTNRIYRIFKAAKSTPVRPKVISPGSQVALSLAFCFIQLLLCVPRYSVISIGYLYPSDRSHVELYCHDDSILFIANFSFVLVLMCGTTFYTFKTRHFPKNFNESKYVGISMYVTCFITSLGLVTYFLVNNEGVKSLLPSLTGVVSGYVIMFCIYARKFVLIRSESKETGDKNPSMQSNISRTTTAMSLNEQCISE